MSFAAAFSPSFPLLPPGTRSCSSACNRSCWRCRADGEHSGRSSLPVRLLSLDEPMRRRGGSEPLRAQPPSVAGLELPLSTRPARAVSDGEVEPRYPSDAAEEAELSPSDVQFAPMLSMRRAQIMETTSNEYSNCYGDDAQLTQLGSRARLGIALDAMEVLDEATEFVRQLSRQLLVPAGGPLEEEEDHVVNASSVRPIALAAAGLVSSPGGTVRPSIRLPEYAELDASDVYALQLQPHDKTKASFLHQPSAGLLAAAAGVLALGSMGGFLLSGAVGATAAAITTTGYSIAERQAGMVAASAPSEPPAGVKGRLSLDCTEMDKEVLLAMMHRVMLLLMGPLAHDVQLEPSDPDGSPLRAPGAVFNYWISAADPNDVDPLRETLLLEAACGGARRLLPLLCEQFVEDGVPMPRRLKVRLKVHSAIR